MELFHTSVGGVEITPVGWFFWGARGERAPRRSETERLSRRGRQARSRKELQADVNLVTALVPSDTACFASSPGRMRRTAVWISRLVTVGFLL